MEYLRSLLLVILLLTLFTAPIWGAESSVSQVSAKESYFSRPLDYRDAVPFRERARPKGSGQPQIGLGVIFFSFSAITLGGLAATTTLAALGYNLALFVELAFSCIWFTLGFLAGGLVFMLYGLHKWRRAGGEMVKRLSIYEGHPALAIVILL